MASINYNKHINEGWTVQKFVDELDMEIGMIMRNQSHVKPFKSKADLKEYCKDNQPYYKKHIPEVVTHFASKYSLK
jgi:type II secretory pathway component PulC